jgi:hypothetical protein
MGSLVIDASGDYIRRTANLPTSFTAFSACGWVKIGSSTAGTQRQIFSLRDTSGQNIVLDLGADNAIGVSGLNGIRAAFSSTPSAGTWVFVAISTDITDVDFGTKGYWWPNSSGTLGAVTSAVSPSPQSGTPSDMAVGCRAYYYDTQMNGNYAYWKTWNRVLTQANFEAEAYSPTFVDETNANTGFADSATDIGPNGRNWTLSGTTTDSDTPPVTLGSTPAFDTAANGYTIAYNTSGSPNTTITGTRPANVVDGELMLAVVGGYNQNNPFVLTAPAGWTPVYSPAFTDGVSTCAMGAWTRVANAASDNFVWTVSADTPDDFIAILRVTGADTSNPLSGTPTESYGSSVSPISPTTQTAHDNALAVFITAATGGSITATDTGYPSGTTGVYARASRADLNAVTHSLAYKAISTVGATGAQTFTNLLSTTGKYWAAASFAIRPDPGGGGGGSAATIVAYYQTMQD